MSQSKAVEFRWGTSRGYETAGYTTCSCTINRDRLGSCSGGGYDLKGTAFAQAFCRAYMPALLTLADRAHSHYRRVPGQFWETEGPKGGKSRQPKYEKADSPLPERERFYGMSTYLSADGKPERVSIDGACGFESVCRIIEGLGFSMQWISGNSKRDTYVLHVPDSIPGMPAE